MKDGTQCHLEKIYNDSVELRGSSILFLKEKAG